MAGSLNALHDNLARAAGVREKRIAASLQPKTGYTPIGAPMPTQAWDAFWGAMDEQRDVADAAGMNFGGFKLDLHALPKSKTLAGPSSLAGLRAALGR